jgi:hypothetical protein
VRVNLNFYKHAGSIPRYVQVDRTQCVGVAFYAEMLHDARVDSDTMRGWKILEEGRC